MTRAELLAFLRAQPWAVEATVHPDGGPQAAVIGVAVTDELELVFDTQATSRKAQNLAREPRIALVIGWDDAVTVQLEGVATIVTGAERDRAQAAYLARFADGAERARDPGIVYVRVRPTWLRHSDFRNAPPVITELDPAALA